MSENLFSMAIISDQMASPYLNKKTYVLKQIVILKTIHRKTQAQIALLVNSTDT